MTDKLKLNRVAIQQLLWQLPLLLILAAVVGLGINTFRADGIPLIGDWSIGSRMAKENGTSLIISFEDAVRAFENQTAVFLDARSVADYEDGHITGALSLPWHEVEDRFAAVTEQLPPDRKIITYCDGESCGLSKELAQFLREMGFGQVSVLVNGWVIWNENGMPIETMVGDTLQTTP